MINSLRITLSILFLATLAISQCPGNDDDAPNCMDCNDDDPTLCDVCEDDYKFEAAFD